nr:hypothetical protein [Methanothrix sp.]
MKMRSIVLLVLAAMLLSTAADGCCGGGGGVDGVGGPEMIDIAPIDDAILNPSMTFQEDGRFGVAVTMGPTGAVSMEFVNGVDARELSAPCPCVSNESLSIDQEVVAHLNEVQLNFDAYWEALKAD